MKCVTGIYGLTVWAISTIGVFVAVSVMIAAATYVEERTETNEIADTLRSSEENAAVIFAFAAGATSLVSAVVAWWVAVMAGDHRDKKVNFSKQLSFLNK